MARPKKFVEDVKESLQQCVEDTNTNCEAKKEDDLPILPPDKKQLSKEKLNRLIAEETKLVKGRFRNYETPGGSLRVQIRKYPGIPAFDKMMNDNQMYEVPLYVARHLNGVDKVAEGCNCKINTCAWPTHGFQWEADKPMPMSRLDDGGIPVPIIGITKWNKRYGFDSLEFDTST